ncbi:hypothetical protein EON81_13865 [bacterium]|nr:MAG: hypothetical protein EON81_13865 [bacterium]
MQIVEFFLGCLIWLPITVWVISLVQWMIAGETDVITGIPGIFVALGMGAVAITTNEMHLRAGLFVAVLLMVCMYPSVRQAMIGRELKAIDLDALKSSYQALEAKPDNAVAKLALAKKAYALGYLASAIGIAEEALNQLPKGVFEGDAKMVKRWKEYAQRDPRAATPPPCPKCGQTNPASFTHCGRCGSAFLLERSKLRFGPSAQGRKLLSAWIAMVAALVGVPAASGLPPALAIVTIIALVALVIAVLVYAFRSGEATA